MSTAFRLFGGATLVNLVKNTALEDSFSERKYYHNYRLTR